MQVTTEPVFLNWGCEGEDEGEGEGKENTLTLTHPHTLNLKKRTLWWPASWDALSNKK